MRAAIIILLIVAALPHARAQEFSVMFYNVENLFDTSDDTTRNDDEFLPSGSRRWTGTRYRKKIAGVSRVIAAAGEWELPAVIGMCEVENEKVVKDLAYSTLLSAGNYGIVHRESPDPRGQLTWLCSSAGRCSGSKQSDHGCRRGVKTLAGNPETCFM